MPVVVCPPPAGVGSDGPAGGLCCQRGRPAGAVPARSELQLGGAGGQLGPGAGQPRDHALRGAVTAAVQQPQPEAGGWQVADRGLTQPPFAYISLQFMPTHS